MLSPPPRRAPRSTGPAGRGRRRAGRGRGTSSRRRSARRTSTPPRPAASTARPTPKSWYGDSNFAVLIHFSHIQIPQMLHRNSFGYCLLGFVVNHVFLLIGDCQSLKAGSSPLAALVRRERRAISLLFLFSPRIMNFCSSPFSQAAPSSRDRIVVSTLRCGRSNPGSNPGHGSINVLTLQGASVFLFFLSCTGWGGGKLNSFNNLFDN